jgi:hypothetical protein
MTNNWRDQESRVSFPSQVCPSRNGLEAFSIPQSLPWPVSAVSTLTPLCATPRFSIRSGSGSPPKVQALSRLRPCSRLPAPHPNLIPPLLPCPWCRSRQQARGRGAHTVVHTEYGTALLRICRRRGRGHVKPRELPVRSRQVCCFQLPAVLLVRARRMQLQSLYNFVHLVHAHVHCVSVMYLYLGLAYIQYSTTATLRRLIPLGCRPIAGIMDLDGSGSRGTER